MPKIAAKISTELRGQVAGETILKYFNEYKMHGGFKEDMRGKHDRLFFLDIFNYTKRWEFFLKYAKKISVQVARAFTYSCWDRIDAKENEHTSQHNGAGA